MLTRLNVGWTYTVLALILVVVSIPAILSEIRWGMKWRQIREGKLQMKQERKRQAIENAEGKVEDKAPKA